MLKSQKGFAPILLLSGILLFLVVVGGSLYFVNENKQPITSNKPPKALQDKIQNLSNTIPPLDQPSPSPLSKEILEKITIVPLNVSNFEKSIVLEDGCNNPVGLVIYSDKNSSSAMKINSTSLTHNEQVTKGVEDLLKFLDTGKQSDYQYVVTLEGVFREYCGGAAHMLVRELPTIKYPGVDRMRALMVLSTQSPGAGSISAVIYAQKGDNLIQLSKYLDQDLYNAHQENCYNKFKDDITDAMDKCYKQEILNDSKLQQLAITEANNLLTRFAIK